MSFLVNNKMCATCIFKTDSPIPEKRFQELKQLWESKQTSQECHHATVKDEQIACRGQLNAWLLGDLDYHPIETAFKTAFKTVISCETVESRKSLYDFCTRMGLIKFQVVDDD